MTVRDAGMNRVMRRKGANSFFSHDLIYINIQTKLGVYRDIV